MIRRISLVIAVVLVLVLAWRLLPGRRTTDAAAGGPDAATPARLAEVENGFKALEDGERQTPRDSWDPDYVLGMVGRDPDSLFAWVRDNTVWIPYHGVLRGPVGVLMDRQGNSLDRALLLATMLDKAGHRVRLAHGEMTREKAMGLLPSRVGRQIASAPLTGESQEEGIPDLGAAAARYQLDGGIITRRIQAADSAVRKASSELRARVADQTDRLLRALGKTDPDADWGRRHDRAVESLRDHWWVQYQVDQEWIDLDVDAVSGALTTMQDTLGLGDAALAPYQQEIAVRVITEQWAEGAVTERKAMERVIRPSQTIGLPIALQFWPLEWVGDSAPGKAGIHGRLPAAPEQRIWIATLLIGNKVDSTVVLLDSGDDPTAPTKGGAFGGFGQALTHTLDQPAGSKADRVRKTLSAVWIEYEIRVPGEPARIIRRTVFDLIGPAARTAPPVTFDLGPDRLTQRGYAMMMRTEILPVNCRLAPEFVSHLVAVSVLGNRELIRAANRGALIPGTALADSMFGNAAPAVGPLYLLALARLEWSRDAARIFIDRPGVLTRHLYPGTSPAGAFLNDATDIVANDVEVNLAQYDGIGVRLAQGVLDTNAESLLRMSPGVSGNAGDAFAVSKDWVTMPPGDGSAPDRVGLPADVRRRIGGELVAGHMVVAPASAVRMPADTFSGWWSIDPATGQALGFSDRGWGDAGDGVIMKAIARVGSRWYIRALGRFAGAFAQDYVWCLAFVAEPEIGYKGLGPGIQAGIAKSWDQCHTQAFAIGGVSAVLPLIAITLKIRRAAKLAQLAAMARRLKKACPIVGANVGPAEGLGQTFPGDPMAEPLGKTRPGDPTADPLGRTNPGESPTSPLGKTKPGSNTLNDPECCPTEQEGPPGGMTPSEAQTVANVEVGRALQNEHTALHAYVDAQSEWMRYRDYRPDPLRDYVGDITKWNPSEDLRLKNVLEQKREAYSQAGRDYNQAVYAQKAAERAAVRASCAAAAAGGGAAVGLGGIGGPGVP